MSLCARTQAGHFVPRRRMLYGYVVNLCEGIAKLKDRQYEKNHYFGDFAKFNARQSFPLYGGHRNLVSEYVEVTVS